MNKINNIIVSALIVSFLFSSGCASLRDKFVRKPKDAKKEKAEDVLFVPEEYPEPEPAYQDKYEIKYMFWKNWHSELINSIYDNTSRKKQLSCSDEAIKNLDEMKALLRDDQKEKLDVYIEELVKIRESLSGKKFLSMPNLRQKLIRLQNKIQKDFSYKKIGDSLK